MFIRTCFKVLLVHFLYNKWTQQHLMSNFFVFCCDSSPRLLCCSCSDPTGHHSQKQGHQEVLGRHLRFWEGNRVGSPTVKLTSEVRWCHQNLPPSSGKRLLLFCYWHVFILFLTHSSDRPGHCLWPRASLFLFMFTCCLTSLHQSLMLLSESSQLYFSCKLLILSSLHESHCHSVF